jgi:hypothetical protein
MDHSSKAQHQQTEQQAHLANVRDDLTWTQFITNLAANKLAPPKSQTSKVLEEYLTRLSEELYVKREGRVSERIQGGDTGEKNPELQARANENQGEAAQKSALASDQSVALAQNQDLVQGQDAPALAVGPAGIENISFNGSPDIARPAGPVQQLHHQLNVGNRWIDVLWQFIVAHQKRILDPERLGIEPSERMDIQVEMIRQIAATYDKLGMLTRLPDSLSEARECKVVDDIRTMALVYVARSIMDVASPKEIAEDDGDENSKKQAGSIEFPRSVISPYEGIRPIEFDPMDLIAGA